MKRRGPVRPVARVAGAAAAGVPTHRRLAARAGDSGPLS